MTVFMLSLAGFPPFVGFFGKLFLFTAGVTGWTWLVVIAVLTAFSVAYYVRVLIPVWTPGPARARVPASISTTSAIVLSGIASLALGLYPTTLLIAGQIGANPISNH